MTGPAGDRWRLAGRRLYLCTPDRPDLEHFVGRCIAGGVDVVQLREKHLGDADLAARAALVQRVCTSEGVPFVLNDRPDLAADMGADGVHVGQDDASAASARAVVGPDQPPDHHEVAGTGRDEAAHAVRVDAPGHPHRPR